MHEVTDTTEYLTKHARLIKDNPGLVWCLEYGINKINDSIIDSVYLTRHIVAVNFD